MTKKLLGAIFTLFFYFGVNSQNTPGLLQNFANPALFNLSDTGCVNVSGEWAGDEVEFYDDKGHIKGKYQIRFILTQQGNKVWGNSLISFGNGTSYGNLKIRGLVLGNKLHFEEYEVVEQKFADPGVTWCLRTGELDIKRLGNSVILEGGNYKGYAAYYYIKCEALVSMYLSKTLPQEELERIEKNKLGKNGQGMQLHPNPANNEVTVSFTINRDEQVKIDMFTLSGEFIGGITNGFYKAGTHQQLFSLGNYAAGVYLIRMQAGTQSEARLLVIAR